MVKKLKKLAEAQAAAPSGLLQGELAGMVKDSAQQIWLAGMGAFAKAQAEGGKVFEALIQEGMALQRKTQGLAEEKIGEVTGRMSSMAGEVTAKAGEHWDRLESIFESRTAKALGRLGVPTAADLQALAARLDALASRVDKLAPTAPAARPARPAKAAGTAAGAATGTRKRAAPAPKPAPAAKPTPQAAPKRTAPARKRAAPAQAPR
ncbi:MAG: phasin family protein [Rubrivivax sp.]